MSSTSTNKINYKINVTQVEQNVFKNAIRFYILAVFTTTLH